MHLKSVSVSIVTTVKNGALYIEEMLNSIRKQTNTNYEHIVVDDGSSDDTLALLKRFQASNPDYRLILIDNSESPGRGRALNHGVSKASADWIAIIDADDIWHPEKLQIQINHIETALKDSKVSVVATKSMSFTGIPPSFETVKGSNTSLSLVIEDFLNINPVCHSSVLIRKDYARYDNYRTSQFDLELWLRLLTKGKQIHILDSCLTYHRKHEKQSFESMLGDIMRSNSYKLKAKYSLKHGYYSKSIKNYSNYLSTRYLPKTIRKLIKRAFIVGK